MSWHCRWGSPSARTGDTRVVSIASWAPWKTGSPSAITSIRRWSSARAATMSRSRTKMFVETLAPASQHTRAAADSNAKPRLPNLPSNNLHGDGQGSRVDFHTGKSGKTGEEEGEVAAKEAPWKCQGRNAWEGRWAQQCMGEPPVGPPCERSKARSPADIPGNTDESQKNFSMHEDASCWHPSAGMPRTPGRRSAMAWGWAVDNALHPGGNVTNGTEFLATSSCGVKMAAITLRQIPDHCVCHLRVPLMDHSQAVRPTGPMCWHTGPPSALQPTSAEIKWQTFDTVSVCVPGAQQLCEALPTGFVVGCSKLSHFIGWNAPQWIRCTGVSAEEEEEPRALQVLNRLDAFVEGRVLLGGGHELGLHKFNMAHWDAQHSDPLFVVWEPSSSPHPGIQIHTLCGRLQCFTPWRDMATAVPHLCLAQVHLGSSILFQRLLQQFVDGGDPFRKARDVDVV